MGTGSYAYSQCSASNPVKTGSVKSASFGFIGTGIEGLTDSVRSIVPKYSVINGAYTAITIRRDGSSDLSMWNHDAYWLVLNSDGSIFATPFKQTEAISRKDKQFSYDCTTLLNSGDKDAGIATTIYRFVFRAQGDAAKEYTVSQWDFAMEFTYPTLIINGKANNDSYGFVQGVNYTLGQSIDVKTSVQNITIRAVPNAGCRFVRWEDDTKGEYGAERTIAVYDGIIDKTNSTKTYTAVFEPVPYVTYDTIFSFRKWKDRGITGLNGAVISDVTDTGFTMTVSEQTDPMTSTTPAMPVVANKRYILEFDTNLTSGFQPFVFYCTKDDSSWEFVSGGTHSDGTDTYNKKRVEFTPTTDWIAFRVDIDGAGRSGQFSDFRIYPAEYSYMSDSVPAIERTDTISFSPPTPARAGYTFNGWFTNPSGGTQYQFGTFPAENTVLYSQWTKNNAPHIFCGNKAVTAYCGNKAVYVYRGLHKIM